MFDIGWAELFIVSVLILIVFGPKDLPKLLYEGGKWLRYIRAYAREFHTHIDQIVRDVELQELKKEVDTLQKIPDQIEKTIDPDHSLQKTFSSIPPLTSAEPLTPQALETLWQKTALEESLPPSDSPPPSERQEPSLSPSDK